MRMFSIVLTVVLLSACSTGGHTSRERSSADARLTELYEREWVWRQNEFGKELDTAGKWVKKSTLEDVSVEARQRRLAYWEAVLEELDSIPEEALSHSAAIDATVFRESLEGKVNDLRYRTYEAPLNSDTFFWTGLYPRTNGFPDTDSYRRYLGRLRSLPRFFTQHSENMRAGMARGYTVPAVSLRGREQSIAAYVLPGIDNPYWTPFESFPDRINEQERARLRAEAREVIATQVVPAYTELLRFMREEYLPRARTSIAASDLPEGDAFYQSQIRVYTTLNLSPEEIHNKGLAEVARIRSEMELILAELDFDGDMAEFFHFLRTDPQFYAQTPDELMGYSAYVAKRMDGRLSEVLGFLPRRRFAINPVPAAIAPTYTGGRGGLSSCLMNTYNLPARPLYTIPALTLHECAPGHALQAAIAREAPGDVPEFRAQTYFSGYGEGWGLYTEWLGGQLGIYRTPYERFGQLTYEMWRACRLVIDTGVHQFGWSRDQAIAYLRDNAAMSEHEITTEIDRYISWPGQALAYKLGEMLLREKRARAETVLGTDFDQRFFHDKILALRSVPLGVLASELDAWIDAGGPNPYPDMPEEVVNEPVSPGVPH